MHPPYFYFEQTTRVLLSTSNVRNALGRAVPHDCRIPSNFRRTVGGFRLTNQRWEGIGSGKDSLLTVQEVAIKLKMAPYTIRKWVRLGQLPALRLGERRIRFMPESIDRWMREQRI